MKTELKHTLKQTINVPTTISLLSVEPYASNKNVETLKNAVDGISTKMYKIDITVIVTLRTLRLNLHLAIKM